MCFGYSVTLRTVILQVLVFLPSLLLGQLMTQVLLVRQMFIHELWLLRLTWGRGQQWSPNIRHPLRGGLQGRKEGSLVPQPCLRPLPFFPETAASLLGHCRKHHLATSLHWQWMLHILVGFFPTFQRHCSFLFISCSVFGVSFSSHCGHLGLHTGCSKAGPFHLRLRETLDVSVLSPFFTEKELEAQDGWSTPFGGCVCVRSPSLHCRDSVNLVVLPKLPLGLHSHCFC